MKSQCRTTIVLPAFFLLLLLFKSYSVLFAGLYMSLKVGLQGTVSNHLADVPDPRQTHLSGMVYIVT